MSNFVTRSGSQLMLNSSPFRFCGTNMYWMGLIQLASGVVRYPTTFEIDDALNTAKEMGLLVIRAHTLGISVGSSQSVWPTLNPATPNTTAFNTIDYAIYKAGLLGLRFIIPLTDQNRYYYGGKYTFTDWRSISDETQFYTNSTVIADFEAYISVILNRVNQYTSVAYKNDSTILCWETGNELSNPFPASTWTDTISTYIKSIDTNHLVLDGCYGVQSGNLSLTNVDIYSNHYYPPQISQANIDASSASGANKAFLIGEVDWRPGIVGGAGTYTLDTSTAADGSQSIRADVTSSSTHVFNVQLRQKNLSLSSGVTYTVSFWAKASVNRTIQAAVQKAVSPFTVYTLPTIVISTTWTQYSFTFTTSGVNDSNAQIAFNLADSISSVWIDMVSITASGVSNFVLNPSFENATIDPWTFQIITTTPDSYPSFVANVESNTAISGDCFWLLMPHNDSYGFTQHNDGYAVYYPVCSSTDQATQVQTIRTHAYTMQGISPAPTNASVASPAITSVSTAPGNNTVAWQGVMGGLNYDIECSTTSSGGPFSVVGASQSDLQAPFVDTLRISAWYRIRAYNYNGVAGPYSSVIPHLLRWHSF